MTSLARHGFTSWKEGWSIQRISRVQGWVENLIGKKVKIPSSDNGGEYTPKELVSFCTETGIMRELIVPYNPQQNGVVERKNRSIEESVKAMIRGQDLPMFL